VLAGGIGGARFVRGLRRAEPDAEITVIGNTGDDLWLHGLRVCPDLDTLMYTLGGGVHEEQGWGRADETFSIASEFDAHAVEGTWFTLGDRDIATHLIRSQMLRAGYPLSDVTAALCRRWRPGVTLLPMSDDRVETHVVLDESGDRRAVHFQEWWVRLRAEVPASGFVFVGAEEAVPAPGVLDAVAQADVILFAPSNPVVSIGPILAVPGLRDALAAAKAAVVGVSPIIGGRAVRGMAEACLTATGVEVSAAGVGSQWADLLSGWLVAPEDAATEVPSVTVRAVPLLMSDADATAGLAAAALALAQELA
jgi:LPPG:FO 2-phospho-L-lactate transferase